MTRAMTRWAASSCGTEFWFMSVRAAQRSLGTGERVSPAMELVRLAIPRRVYTHTQLDYVAEVVAEVMAMGKRLRGLEITYEPPALRHFTAKFDFLESAENQD